MNIPKEVRERIIALYHGLKVGISRIAPGRNDLFIGGSMSQYNSVSVKHLNMITDEDAIEVAKIVYNNPNFHTSDFGKKYVKIRVLGEFEFSGNYYHFSKMVILIDFLRSRGYGIDAFGYSVDQLVEAGVFKLAGNG